MKLNLAPRVWSSGFIKDPVLSKKINDLDREYIRLLGKTLVSGIDKIILVARGECSICKFSDENEESSWHKLNLSATAEGLSSLILAMKEPGDEGGLCQEIGINGEQIADNIIIEAYYLKFLWRSSFGCCQGCDSPIRIEKVVAVDVS